MITKDYDALFDAAGKQYNVDPKLIKTAFVLETGGNAQSNDSYQGAQGGMQMLPATAKAMGADNPRDMAQAVPAAARYLREGLDSTGSPEGALAYYHGGPNRAIWGPKTQAYVAKGQSTYGSVDVDPTYQPMSVRNPGSYQVAAGGRNIPPPPTRPPAATPTAVQPAEEEDFAAKDFERRTGVKMEDAKPEPTTKPGAVTVQPKPAETATTAVQPAEDEDFAAKDFERRTGVKMEDANPANAPSKVDAQVAAEKAKDEPSGFERVGVGALQGVKDLGNELAKKYEAAGITPWLRSHGIAIPDMATLQAKHDAEAKAYDERFGKREVLPGVERAVRDIADKPAALLAKGSDKVGLTDLLKQHGVDVSTGADVEAQNKADLDAYEKEHGDSIVGKTARYGTQAALITRLLSIGGGIAGGATDAAGAGAARLGLPAVEKGIGTAKNIIAGTEGVGPVERGVSLGINGAVQSGAASAITAGQSDKSVSDQIQEGALAGGIAGPVIGGAAKGVSSVVKGLRGTDGAVEKHIAGYAKKAVDAGIPVTASDIGHNPLINFTDEATAHLPFSGIPSKIAAKQEGLNRAVGRTFGAVDENGKEATKLTSDVMDRTAKRISDDFKDVESRVKKVDAEKVHEKLLDVDNYINSPESKAKLEELHGLISSNIEGAVRGEGGSISPQNYKGLLHEDSPLIKALSSDDPALRDYATNIKNGLEAAYDDSLSYRDQLKLRKAKDEYRAMKTVEPLLAMSPKGDIPPDRLLGAVKSNSDRFDGSIKSTAYKSDDTLTDLGRIGQMFFERTAPQKATNPLLNASLLTGGITGGLAFPLYAAGAGASTAGAIAAGRYARGEALAKRMIASSLEGPAAKTGVNPIIGANAPLIGNNIVGGYNAGHDYLYDGKIPTMLIKPQRK